MRSVIEAIGLTKRFAGLSAVSDAVFGSRQRVSRS